MPQGRPREEERKKRDLVHSRCTRLGWCLSCDRPWKSSDEIGSLHLPQSTSTPESSSEPTMQLHSTTHYIPHSGNYGKDTPASFVTNTILNWNEMRKRPEIRHRKRRVWCQRLPRRCRAPDSSEPRICVSPCDASRTFRTQCRPLSANYPMTWSSSLLMKTRQTTTQRDILWQ